MNPVLCGEFAHAFGRDAHGDLATVWGCNYSFD